MNSNYLVALPLALSSLLHAGETDIDLAALPASKDAKGPVVIPTLASAQRWSLSAGFVVRKLGDIRFNTGISPDMIPNLFGVDTFSEPPGIGSLRATADRTYDDGFVNIGAGTPGTGLTTFWEYNNATQVQGGNLVFSKAGGERRDVTMRDAAAPTGWSDGPGREAGPFLELNYTKSIQPNLSVGIAVNFSTVNIGGSQGGLNTISQFQQLDIYDVAAVDTYSLNGVIPPNAPYQGSFAGPGPLINNVPDTRAFPETLSTTTTALFVDRVRESLKVDFHTLGVGSTVHWRPRPRLLLAAQAGIALNLADWRTQRDEVITQSINGGPAAPFSRRTVRTDDKDFSLGVYLQGNVAWKLNERWAMQLVARYDWNPEIDGFVGPSSFEVDLSGWSLGAGARLAF